ncbi:MAG TPA: cation diffusion facilitator family transporter [Bacteroidia bacterium]|nr:cation diffusion facilitator family transporter [Bacteroidia bacterium]
MSEQVPKKPFKNYWHIPHYTNERRMRIVVVITAITMVVEIWYGLHSRSMALLADGWHMASHVFAMGLTWIVYVVSRRNSSSKKYFFRENKLLALSGFTSAMALLAVAIFMATESVTRLLHPMVINFKEALIVECVGLFVNVICTIFLHHDKSQSDHNIRAAYIHILADAVSGLGAIIALTAGLVYHITYLDAISGIISAFIITKWSLRLIKDAGSDLIEFKKM